MPSLWVFLASCDAVSAGGWQEQPVEFRLGDFEQSLVGVFGREVDTYIKMPAPHGCPAEALLNVAAVGLALPSLIDAEG